MNALATIEKYNEIICFSSDTKVLTHNGEVAISDIEIGMEVMSYNEIGRSLTISLVTSKGKSLHTISAILRFEGSNLLHLTIDHPVYVESKGWCSLHPDWSSHQYDLKVSELKVGDSCLSIRDNGLLPMKLIDIDLIEINETFYSIGTETNTFFANCFLVHDENILSLANKGHLGTNDSKIFRNLKVGLLNQEY